jgi:hypothetical protein
MRFWTIWTIPAMSLTERLRRTWDWAAMKIAFRLPYRIRYWSLIGMVALATKDSPGIPATTVDEMLRALRCP